jgi:hypothetical protein
VLVASGDTDERRSSEQDAPRASQREPMHAKPLAQWSSVSQVLRQPVSVQT